MELLGPSAKMRRPEDLAACEPPPRVTEAMEAANSQPTTHGKESPPPPDTGGGGGVDRISGLPDAILGEIVSLLSTKEVARTQTVASRWRHIWRASPLVLDGNDLYVDPKNATAVDEKLFSAADEALARAFSLILSVHPGPGRRFCVPPQHLRDRPAAVDAWLRSPALDNLQELDFWEGEDVAYRYILPFPLAPPPASMFRFSATLQVATFAKCELLDSYVEGIHFPNLKQLALEDVNISEASLHTMISSCPVLEFLLLQDCFGPGCLRISSNSLRSIAVGGDRRRSNLHLKEVIIVDAPFLENYLHFHAFMATNVTVISAPKLEILGCINDDWFDPARLVFGTAAIEGLNVVSLTTALSNIKILAVASCRINLDLVIALMKCFPCLEKLYIKSCISGDMNRWRRKHKGFIKSFDIRLKTIVLKQYRGIRSQVNFASFFLLNARKLESMRLEVLNRDYNEAFFAEQHGMLQMEKRASRAARLHFTADRCVYRVHANHVRDLSIADPFECRC